MQNEDYLADNHIYLEKLSNFFFDVRCKEASANGWLGRSTWRAFRGDPKEYKGQIKAGLECSGEYIKEYLSTHGADWKSIAEYDSAHRTMLDLFKNHLRSQNVICASEGTYIKALNIVIWHYVLGEGDQSNISARKNLNHLKSYLHPSFDGDVLRGIMNTILLSHGGTCPIQKGWNKDNSSGWITSYPDYIALIEWTREATKPLPAIILERFWNMVGCEKQ